MAIPLWDVMNKSNLILVRLCVFGTPRAPKSQ